VEELVGLLPEKDRRHHKKMKVRRNMVSRWPQGRIGVGQRGSLQRRRESSPAAGKQLSMAAKWRDRGGWDRVRGVEAEDGWDRG
jgi:hypothetical protein